MKPLIRSNILINTNPAGLKEEVERQIAYVKAKNTAEDKEGKTALILGCSTGYGLSSRITAAFAYKMHTIGVSLEKEPTERRNGTAGFYNNEAFDEAAKRENLDAKTFNLDAFSDEARKEVVEYLKNLKKTGGKVDLFIYSLASPVRKDPENGTLYKSLIKSIGQDYSGKAVNIATDKLETVTVKGALREEIDSTVKVMGGEDLELWVSSLLEEGLLHKDSLILSYSYIGPECTHAIYLDGTIGEAKKDLQRRTKKIDEMLKKNDSGRAYVSVNKGLVTKSSAVIPVISLYLSVLFKVMKGKGTHEGCIEQMYRLFNERLYTKKEIPTDENGLIRIDDLEMNDDVQQKVKEAMEKVTDENMKELCDIKGFKEDFLLTGGFKLGDLEES